MADLSGVSSANLELLLEFNNDFTDSSGNGLNQSPVIGAAEFVSDGAVAQAAKFSYPKRNEIDTGGQNVGTASLFAAAGEAWSVSTLFRFTGASILGTGTLCARQKGTGQTGVAQSNFFLHVTTNKKLLVRLRGADNIYSVNMHDGDWHHVGVTWDGTTAAVYFDGIAQSVPSVGGVSEFATNIWIAGSDLDVTTARTSNLVGQLDDFRIYSRALSAAEMFALAIYGDAGSTVPGSPVELHPISPADLELFLRFEGDLTDDSIREADQTLAAGSELYEIGVVDVQSHDFQGTAYIDTADDHVGAATLFADTGQSWSVMTWFKATSGLGTTLFSRHDNAFVSRRMLRVDVNDNGGNYQIFIDARDSSNTENTTAVVGEWAHLALTWDGSDLALYIDGSVVNSSLTVGIQAEDSTNNFLIGARFNLGAATDFWPENMDDFRVYARAVTPTEVSTIVSESRGFDTTLTLTSISGDVASMQVVFERAAAAFVAGDVTAVNGTVGNVAGSGTTWTFDVTATVAGVVSASIAAGAVDDNNSPAETNNASDTVSWGTVADPADTGLLQFDRTVAPTFTASAIIGPIKISPNANQKGIIQKMRAVLGNGTSCTADLNVSADVDGESVVDRQLADAEQFTETITTLQNNNGVSSPRVAGHAAVFEIDVTTGHCILEEIQIDTEVRGRNRAPRYS